ncbi:hypothetical protein COEREDRAFT_82730 [Coemansia reversa NRRL 1564]|uniref:L domain-like protein n=1 Tax=Coemansia reversa (strain ATCC 12441 / NRRL 1564) TaxID=763665 RepID=A0A2G5B634_COERN|nr:hypothetical protein COEREDRAFT_82730 [Coemansia reversa NRRL 1564]|eukprot:PIA14459.1 hypothetical protein COEREDRAFT_82730 [Coemansia reversa NRRL 1564]
MRRSRPSSVASSVNWNLSATSDLTLLPGSSYARHTRNASESSEFLGGFTAGTHGTTFDFQLHSAVPEPLWPPDASPLASDGDASDGGDDNLARRIPMSGFPSSCSAHFNVELGRDTESACESPRTRTRSSGANAPRDAARAQPKRVYPRASRAIMSLLDPSSPVHGDTEHSMALNMLGHPRRQRAYTSAVPDAEREDPAELSDPLDFDGSTLTQQNDWLLMNPSSSDNDMPQPLPHHSHTRRRVRKRRVLPKSMFPVPAKHDHAPVTATPNHDLLSSDTLRLRSDIVTRPVIPVRQSEVPLPATTSDASRRALPFAAATPAPPPPEMVRLLRLEVIPRMPLSIQRDMRIAHVARLALQCSGDALSWQSARISCFDLRLAACIGRAHGLVELSLVNLGLTAVPVCLVGCHGLRRLDMAHNWIATAPGWLGRLHRLEHLRLAGNPLRMISADLVELRHHLLSLDLGRANTWSLISRRPAPLPELSPDKRKRVLAARLQSAAAHRVAAYLDAAVLKVTRRQHDDARARATRLLGLYSDTLYAALREPRNWGHSVAMPLPSGL